jgi:hypothetical protein
MGVQTVAEMMNYDLSPIPSKTPGGIASERHPDRGIGVDGGKMTYESGAESGHTEIILPALPASPHGEERMLAKDFGPFVAGKIESSMSRQGYMRSGPQQSPAATFRHYVAVAAGASLVDTTALGNMKVLAQEFSEEADQRGYFESVLRPYLHSLRPSRR